MKEKFSKKILLLFAHPSQNNSEINVPMFEMAKTLSCVTCIDLYAEYPKYNINVSKEQERLLNHDIVIFQFPLYWYSSPAILKEWQDLVFEYGFAYGKTGTKLHGKSFLCVLSAGGKESTYCAEGKNHFYIDEVLIPFRAMTNLTGLTYIDPFVLFDARLAIEKGKFQTHLTKYRELLVALGKDDIKKVDEIIAHNKFHNEDKND